MTLQDDARWMRRAVRLALRSLGATWPNPGVGCVLVRDGRLLGEGRHRRCGGPHAEIEALDDAHRRGLTAAGATVYVTLAPCTRHGRTPPCCQALIAERPARVVAAVADPSQDDPAGRLGGAGIAYSVGVEGALAGRLHGGFLNRVLTGRPRITGKWAMTLDGCIATHAGHAAWISSPEAIAYARRRRRIFDCVVVGAGTALADNPRLGSTARDGRSPMPVVLSARARLAPDSALVGEARRRRTLLVHDHRADPDRLAALAAAGLELLAVDDCHDPLLVAAGLGAYGFNDCLIEGGSQVHGAFLRADAYDRIECYLAARTLGGGVPAAAGSGVARIADGRSWRPEAEPFALGHTWLLRLDRERERPR